MNQLPTTLQQLPPRCAHLCLEVEKFVYDTLKVDIRGKKLVLAVSGGADSTAMFVMFKCLSPRLNLKMCVAHLNHGIRKEAIKEAEFVQSLSKEFKVPFFYGKTNAILFSEKKRIGLEEGARLLRYRFLKGVMKKSGSDLVLVAHHLNDLAEDILLRLLRGSFWPTVAGMDGYDQKRNILRPLLFIPKVELLNFLKELKIQWMEDISNQDRRFKRNRIRLDILPLFERENPNFLNSIKRMWLLSQIDREFWESNILILKAKEKRTEQRVIVKREFIASLPKALRLRWSKEILKSLGGGNLVTETLLDMDRALEEGKTNKIYKFPQNRSVRLKSEEVIFSNLNKE